MNPFLRAGLLSLALVGFMIVLYAISKEQIDLFFWIIIVGHTLCQFVVALLLEIYCA